MRTTIDIPDDLLREAKARAALRGMKLKEYVAEALQMALFYPLPGADRSKAAEEQPDQLVLDDDCVFPILRGEGGPEMKRITGKRIGRILEEEDVARETDTR